MSTDFPHPHHRYYLVDLDCDGIPITFWDSDTRTTGSDSQPDIIQRAQYLIMKGPNKYRYGLAIIEILDVITPIIVVTVHHESPIQPDPPEVWDDSKGNYDSENR